MNISTFGRGRGAVMAKMFSSSINGSLGISQEVNLMTPSQFKVDVVYEKNPEHNKDKTDEDLLKNDHDCDFAILSCNNSGRNDDFKESEEREVYVVVKDNDLDKIAKAEKEWKIYQYKRKINKIIKEVNHENLKTVMEELAAIIDKCSLSSRYVDCSEIKELLEVLIQKSVNSEEFLVYSPCLIKMIAEQDFIQFNKYFVWLVNNTRKESVTLCSSGHVLPKAGENFCKLLGSLLSLARQTGNSLYDVVSTITDDLVKRWTYADEDQCNAADLKEDFVMLYVNALKVLLTQIKKAMYSYDNEVLKRLERYIWYTRESILNIKLPREIRTAYLDLLIDVQIQHNCDSSAHSELMTETTNGASETDEVLQRFKDDDLPDDYVEVEEDGCNYPEVIETQGDTLVSTAEIEKLDGYKLVKVILDELQMDDLLPTFMEYGINDLLLASPLLKAELKFNKKRTIVIFEICHTSDFINKLLHKLIILGRKLEERRLDELKKRIYTSPPPTICTHEESETRRALENPNCESCPVELGEQFSRCEVPSRNEGRAGRSSASSRMAINFNPNKSDLKQSPIIPIKIENVISSEQSDLRHVVIGAERGKEEYDVISKITNIDLNCDRLVDELGNFSSDSEPDLVIEGEEDLQYEENTNILNSSKSTYEQQTSTSNLFEPLSMPFGRGQGVIQFSKSNYNDRTVFSDSRFNQKPGNKNIKDKNENQSFPPDRNNQQKWINRTNGENWKNNAQKASKKNQSRYHSKKVLDEQQPRAFIPATEEFGLRRPSACLRCSSAGHTEDNCPVINPFF